MRDGLCVGLTNSTSIQATHTSLLPADGPLPPLSKDALCVRLFPGLTSKALISIGQSCDDGYSAVFTVHTVLLVEDKASTVVVHRNQSNGLWDIDLSASNPPPNTPYPQAHVNIIDGNYRVITVISSW